MLFSYNWLKEYVATSLTPAELSTRLTMAGVEVEAAREGTPPVKGIVVAEILTVGPHPNADRLKLCQVNTGEGGERSVVCGASNMKEGDRVALAVPGTKLPGGVKIKKSKIRGVVSEGMLCSEVELGIRDTSDGIMILPADAPLGSEFSELTGEGEGGDTMLDIAITPNRADLLSVRGLAREVGAITGDKFTDVEFSVPEGVWYTKEKVSVTIDAPELCRRYAARVVEGVKIGPSPPAVAKRLEAHGIRPINNVVDVTNYVLLEMGQPLHAFDLEKVRDHRITVRAARSGEKMETLDGVTRKLEEGMLLICDGKGEKGKEKPVAIAGIMGGGGSEVSDTTEKVLIESAWFDPVSVRRTSRKLGLATDSSYRFGRGVDIDGVPTALDRAASMIAELAGGKVSRGAVDAYPVKFKPRDIEFRIAGTEALLGTELKPKEVKDILTRLGMDVKASRKKDSLIAVPPSYRVDLERDVDITEEVARVRGYDKVPVTMPTTRLTGSSPAKLFRFRRKVKEILVNAGFFETLNYSFVSPSTFEAGGEGKRSGVTILNPLSEEQSVMRDALLPSLLETLKLNLSRKNEEARIFEFAPVYLPRSAEGGNKGKDLPEERWRVAGLMSGLRLGEGWNVPSEPLDFYDVKGVVERLTDGLGINIRLKDRVRAPSGAEAENEKALFSPYSQLFHPLRSAILKVRGKDAGLFGQLHPDTQKRFDLKGPAFAFEFEAAPLLAAFGGYGRFKPLPRYPESSRDISFIVDDGTAYGEIVRAIRGLGIKVIENIKLFDVYYGGAVPEGSKSMAMRVIYRSPERTLKYSEVEEIHAKVTGEIAGKFNADIRV
ncbi:MAG: phenylalanine--tRNA ligase subunit beta [Thermodesulfobacteriota bacterium]